MSQDYGRRRAAVGRGTLVENAYGGAIPGKVTLVERQRLVRLLLDPSQDGGQPAIDPGEQEPPREDPGTTQANAYQFAPGTTNFNDCGPCVILDALRAMGLEDELIARVARDLAPGAAPTFQQLLDFIRAQTPNAAGDVSIFIGDLRTGLVAVIAELGVTGAGGAPLDAAEMFTTVREAGGSVREFIEANTGGGSAVCLLGTPFVEGGWGWGGTSAEDAPNRRRVGDRAQNINLGGGHFIYVWRAARTDETYTVFDPSWSTPRTGIALDPIVAFVTSFSSGRNAFRIPYADVAALASRANDAPVPPAEPYDPM